MSDPIASMIDALDLEIAAVRKQGGSTQIELQRGEYIGPAAEAWLYRFPVIDELTLHDETPIRIVIDKENITGIIVSFRDGVLTVALDKDLGPTIASARLIADDTFLLERLKERLEKVKNGEAQFCRQAADRVIGLSPPIAKDAVPHRAVITDGALNEAQIRALHRSLGSSTTFLWGPPGTGKTTTLARIVEAHYRAGRSVLLVSNTNIAVDTALERVAERLEREPDFDKGLVLRHGPVVKEELRQRYGSQVIVKEIVARLSASLQQEKVELEREQDALKKEEQELRPPLQAFERLASVRDKLDQHKKIREKTMNDMLARRADAKHYRAQAERTRADLQRAQSMGRIRRFFAGLNPKKLAQELASAEQAAQRTQQTAETLFQNLQAIEEKILSLEGEEAKLTKAIQGYPQERAIRSRLEAIARRLPLIRQRLSDIERELSEIEQQVLARCRILATTAYRTYLGKAPLRSFDTVVVDEASMLMPPLVFYTAGLATQAVTVAGDFRQLPPIVVSEEPLAEEWLRCDVFEKADIPSQISKGQVPPYLVVLDTQYRMREPICAVINTLFYADHPLKSHPSVDSQDFAFPFGSAPLFYIDTSSFNPWASFRMGTFSRYNLFHALLIRNIVLHLAEIGFLPVAGEPNDAVGVVSPYAAQARLIQAVLDERLGDRAIGIAATVHRFQGNEKRAMLLDLTDSLGSPLSRFLKARRIEEDGARLLNVAASRARHHLIVIANFDYLRGKGAEDACVRRLIEHFAKHGEALDIEELLSLGEREWIDALRKIVAPHFDLPEKGAGVFNEGSFYPAFSQDLLRARQSIIILSPFAKETGTARWADVLRAALARGVRVRILTRPPGTFGGGDAKEVISALRSMGMTVDLREHMHEKIAIIDERILWHGSLNILSHRDTQESMLRFDSPAACQQLGRFLTTPTSKKQEQLESPLADQENPPCPECGNATIWKTGRYGIWFECEEPDCGGKVNTARRNKGRKRQGQIRQNRKTKSSSGVGLQGSPCPAPGCRGILCQRKGRFGSFLGCSEYPRCRYAEEVD
ncbi:MAG: hypothetical protein D6690_02565 [Nitrospirae bacterium]|nr:MAG: hypothetical protein D6690_02565 [Nitrospirota bacterium]